MIMRRDGDEEDSGHKKRPLKRRSADYSERLMPKKRHPAVLTGMAFAILGGLMIASTFLVSWVDSYDISTNALMMQLYAWSLAGHPEWGAISYLALLAPILGAVCAILSGTALANEKRIGLRRLAAMGVLVTSVMAAFIIIALIWLLKEEYIAGMAYRSIYGPAIFLSVFGCVLAVAGGIVLVVDYIQSERGKGSFVTTTGSKHLKTALRPVKRGHPGRERESQDKEIRDEMLATEERSDPSEDEEEMACPSCKSPVRADSKVCPICGEELG
jgi:hypothetical protein